MNTEPPEGDDLHRMLVSMKQNVLERATPRPQRRRFRPGIALGVVGLLAIGTATGAVALSLSQQETPVAAPTQTQQPEPAPTATTPSSAPITERPTPRPTPTETPAARSDVRIPGDCYLLVPDEDYDRFFGAASHTSQVLSPGLSRDPDGNDRIRGLRGEHESLSCTWQNEGVEANLVIAVGHTEDIGAGTPEDTVANLGGTCQDRLGGRACRTRVPTERGGTVTATTFLRDGITITIYQTDFPTDGLLPAIVGEIWGD